ncbi:MAG: cation transporter [Candidatus Gastranaerophilales bacterium]|jgi:cation diffusion facilitator family transporter|nr:cation transporter [Candidatus Gastranaerophilales bacterium]
MRRNVKTKAAAISIISNSFLIVLKLLVGMFTNSISIISEAIHSLMDLLAAVIAFLSVKKSSEPADDDHQYGHGKYEDASGFVEGALILAAAGYIIYEAAKKLLTGNIDYIDSYAGIAVMLMSVFVNIYVSRTLFRVAQKTDSMALLADAEHLRTDVLTSLGVLIGLVLIKLTGYKVLDPIIAIFVAMLIIKAGMKLCVSAVRNLLDSSLPEADIIKIKGVLEGYMPHKVIRYENLKTRKAGAERLIEFTLILHKEMSLKEAHNICDEIENCLQTAISSAILNIHMEPCQNDCTQCNLKKCIEFS